MLFKGTKLLSFTYRLGGSELVSVVRGVSKDKVFKRLFNRYCYDWHRNIKICAYPSGEVLYDGSVGRLEY